MLLLKCLLNRWKKGNNNKSFELTPSMGATCSRSYEQYYWSVVTFSSFSRFWFKDIHLTDLKIHTIRNFHSYNFCSTLNLLYISVIMKIYLALIHASFVLSFWNSSTIIFIDNYLNISIDKIFSFSFLLF